MRFPTRQPRAELFDELRDVVTSEGPYLSVYLDLLATPPATERFLAAVDRTAVPENVVDRVAELIGAAEGGDDALFVCIAAASGPLIATSFPDPPRHDVIESAAVPRLGPFIESDQALIHHVVAVIDPSGMTLIASPRHGKAVRETLIGRNTDGAAELIARVAQMTDTSLVLIVGSPTSLDAVHPLVVRDGRLFCPVLRVESEDVPGAIDGDLADELVRLVADRSSRRVVEALRLYRYFESHEAGADGVVATVDALRSGRASMLLVHDDPDDERQGWFGPEPQHIAHDLTDVDHHLPMLGDGVEMQNGRLVDVVLRSALGQRVPVMVVPAVPDDRLADGMGVLYHVDGFADAGLVELIER